MDSYTDVRDATAEDWARALGPKPGPKVRDDETWEKVRRCWENGETGAALALRFDVGLANLWRRRAAEGWSRERQKDRPPEPAEGWRNHAAARQTAFREQIQAERRTARALQQSLAGERPEEVPVWHLGFVVRWRAETLGAETAAAEHARLKDTDWGDCVWNADGSLRPLEEADLRLVRLERDAWREWAGLPPGAAPEWP